MNKSACNRLLTSATVFALALAAVPASAHPGHSLTDATVSHLLLSPYHLAVMTLLGIGMYAGARFVQRQVPQRVLRYSGVALMLASAVLWGLHT